MAEVEARKGGLRTGRGRVRRVMAAGVVAGLVAAVGAVAIDARPAAAAGSTTYGYTGTIKYFNVPLGITEVLIEAWGAQGYGADGGKGGYVRAILPVRPGEGLAVAVGGAGGDNGGGWNGGGHPGGGSWTVPGGGGGASDVRRFGDSLTRRVLVAGGGGGVADSRGGDGGYPAGTKGGDNGVSVAEQGAEGGYGGELTRGGWGGFGFCGSGNNGDFAIGGTGATGTFSGGGGGGGYYGGGGGGAGCSWGGAGGGGGSSWTDPTMIGALYKTGAGYGHGKVVIAWSPEGWPDSLRAPAGFADPRGETDLDPLHHEAEVHDRTVLENLGDSDVPTLGQPYVPSAWLIGPKEALLAELQPWVAEQSALGLKDVFTPVGPEGLLPCPSRGCPPATKTLTQPLSHQERNYWAGPATTQLVLQQMRGSAPTQTQLAAVLGTEHYRGTSPDAIAYGLNSTLGFERFYAKTLASGPTEYLSAVIAATHFENHSVVNNIKTSALPYWGPIETTAPAKHHNITYGYSFAAGGIVHVAEQYDTTRVATTRPVNPFGYHTVLASDMYRAILANKGIVVW